MWRLDLNSKVMSKKSLGAIITSLAVVFFTVFSFSNALVLAQEGGEGETSEPLTSPRELCQEAKDSYRDDVAATRAKGLSLQLPPEEVKELIQDIKDYRKKVCAEAAALTSAVKLCKEARADFNRRTQETRAKGLSSHLSKAEIRQLLKDIRDYRKKVCDEAAEERRGNES